MARVLVIGIDGGTFDIIRPLIKRGKLRNLARIIDKGSSGFLETTMPPMTFPAWNSFMTGVNPGKHGVFDFTQRIPGTYSVRFINGKARMAQTIWKLASDAGKRVGVMAVPVTWPPEKVNGFMISGFDAPGVGGAVADALSVHPPELIEEIKQNVGQYVIASNIRNEVDRGRQDLAVDIILKTLGKKIATAAYLYKKEPWDLFMVLFGESDLAGHFYWRYMDQGSPFFDPQTQDKCKTAIEAVYEKIDMAVGQLVDMAPGDTTVVLMSDHGFGGVGDTAIYLNRWLEKEGFLGFKDGVNGAPGGALTRPLMLARKYGLKYVPAKLKQVIIRKNMGVATNLESWLRFSRIDWGRTAAYSEETPYFPTIWLNQQGREPEGTISENERDGVLSRLEEALYQWKDPFSNENVVRKVFRREEIYDGPHTVKAPDLIIDYNEPGGYSYLSRTSFSDGGKETIRKITRKELEAARFQNKVGSHRNLGIFMAFGEGIRQGAAISGARILDIAPTILHLLGIPIPPGMDGKVVNDCLREDLQKKETTLQNAEAGDVQRVHAQHHANAAAGQQEQIYSQQEEDQIRDRLKDLGYIGGE